MIDTKYVSQLVNAHKVSGLLIPLIEAVEINRVTRGVDRLSVKDLLKHVVESGGEIFQSLLDENDRVLDTGLIPDKLFLTLSKSLRNNIVLYNNPSLSLVKDDMIDLFDSNIDFIQRYKNDAIEEVVKNSNGKTPENEKKRSAQEALGHASGAISQMFMPVWVFHTNLYTSGFLDEESLTELNRRASNYLVKVLDTIVKRMGSSHEKCESMFKIDTLFICAEMIANIIHDYNRKLIKNKKELENYIENPEKTLSRLVPAIYSNFSVLNKIAEETLSDVFSES